MKWFRTATVGIALLLIAGCVSRNSHQAQWVYPPMAIPLQHSVQDEVQIARLTQLLQRQDLSDKVRTRMLNERGEAYDNVGLQDLARLDFAQSISIDPKQPEVFNLLGVYYTGVDQHDAAYDSFDTALEMDPKNLFALRNRAVALYYGERPELGLEDMHKLDKQQKNDPFNALWEYIMQYDLNPAKAKQDLEAKYSVHTDQWGWTIVALMLDEVSEQNAFETILQQTHDNELLARRLTETYFYLGKRYQLNGELAHAISLYKLAISFNVYDYVEHRYSFLELERIYKHVRDAQEAENKAQKSDKESDQA
ncbi:MULTISPECIES: lipoprotein NlpI [Vibrio]|uniref:Lipoprotein NlpI n=2 Tax=Vibrio TaxID=662 RepID=A0A7X4LJ62_9VIBR|nr:lipoprotein NlpI [Vibrio nitrifigilis]MBF8999233.1 lipoprotein NlpI [Vibrio nitrifigilis]MZI92596.1 lipoprotein NlpI [Vibrio eleionomae]